MNPKLIGQTDGEIRRKALDELSLSAKMVREINRQHLYHIGFYGQPDWDCRLCLRDETWGHWIKRKLGLTKPT